MVAQRVNGEVKALSDATTAGLVIKGAASQSASLQEWQLSDGSIVANISPTDGYLSSYSVKVGGVGIFGQQFGTLGRLSVYAGTATTIGAVIRGAANQTANLQEWQDSTPATVASVSATGVFKGAQFGSVTAGTAYINTNADTGGFQLYTNATTNKGLVILGATSQTAVLQEWQVQGIGTVARVDNGGGVHGSFLYAGGYVYRSANLNVNVSAANIIGAVIRAAANQTANLQEWQSDTGGILSRVRSDGHIVAASGLSVTSIYSTTAGGPRLDLGNSYTLVSTTATNIGFIVKGAANQTANLQEWQNSAGTPQLYVTSSGVIKGNGTFNSGATATQFDANGNFTVSYLATLGTLTARTLTATLSPLVVQGAASQTANLTTWQDSGSTVLAGMNPNAQLFSGSTTPLYVGTGGATTAASGDGTTATITTTSAHGLAVGDMVTVAGVTPTGYNDTKRVTAVPTTTSFSYANATTGAQTVAGTVSAAAQASIVARSAGTAGLIVRGAASQVNDLFRVQDSNGNNLFRIDAGGTVVMYPNLAFGVDYITGRATSSGAYLQTSTTHMYAQARAATNVPLIAKGAANQSASLTEWQDSSSNVLAKVTSGGVMQGAYFQTTNAHSVMIEENSGGRIRLTKATASASNPGADMLKLYVVAGTDAGTLKLVVRAGTAGAETTILDNIPQ